MISQLRRRARALTLLAAISAVTVVVAGIGGCTSSDEAEENQAEVRTVEPIPGMKYYVGGPVMRIDKYGRMRLGEFNGEVRSPTPRGLLVGFKKNDDGTFDFRTWLNGMLVSKSDGFLDDDELLWYTNRISYDADGAVAVRQAFEYDDDAKIMKTKLEHLDPDTGEVVDTFDQEIPYTPPAKAEVVEEDPEQKEFFADVDE